MYNILIEGKENRPTIRHCILCSGPNEQKEGLMHSRDDTVPGSSSNVSW